MAQKKTGAKKADGRVKSRKTASAKTAPARAAKRKAAAKAVKPAAKAVKRVVSRKAAVKDKNKKISRYGCEVCGLVVSVDEWGDMDVVNLVCCGGQMQPA